MLKVKIQKIHEDAVIPEFATAGAACMDVVATEIDFPEGGKAIVRLGFSTELPVGYKACFSPRSSLTHKNWILANTPAQIDSDYRGEWMIKFQAIPQWMPSENGPHGTCLPGYWYIPNFIYKVGDRVAQMWLEKVVEFTFEEVTVLQETARGAGGFGSTNK